MKFLSHKYNIIWTEHLTILCLSDKIEYSPNHIFEGTYVWIPRKNTFSPSNNNMVT